MPKPRKVSRMEKVRVGVIGATGMVGQRLLCLMENHPFFEVRMLMAGDRSAGKSYEKAVDGRWKLEQPMPAYAKSMQVFSAEKDIGIAKREVDFVFSAVSMPKERIRLLEEAYATAEIPVVSNNSACRMLSDVPMLIPEINPHHLAVLSLQKKRLGTRRGFIVTKPNCSIQSYVPALTPLSKFGLRYVAVSTYQAVSGAGKTLSEMEEISDNVIPFILGEEEKSQQEPLKIWGDVSEKGIVFAKTPLISAQCVRVPVSDGHTATVFVTFSEKPQKEDILSLWEKGEGFSTLSGLPSAPARFLTYLSEENRPQPRLDRMQEGGMGVTVGRLREDALFHYKFVCLSHNTLRGAGGGALLTAEYLFQNGCFDK